MSSTLMADWSTCPAYYQIVRYLPLCFGSLVYIVQLDSARYTAQNSQLDNESLPPHYQHSSV